ncbi:MAG: ABC transporter ATP-binding protein [Clostridiaceae bacterium]|nr:ABC transporter ATP-binding protein [Clostridiaceae bacterium]
MSKNKQQINPDLEEYTKEQLASRKNFSLKRLFNYAIVHWPWFILSFLLIVLTTASTLIQPRIIQVLIDKDISILISDYESQVVKDIALISGAKKALFYLFTVIITFIGTYLQAYILNSTGQKILLNIRQNLYEHILKLPVSFFDRYPIGSLVTRVTNDTETLNEMFTSVFSSVLRNAFTLVGIIISMFLLDVKIAIRILVVLPILIIISLVFRNVMQKIYFAQRRLLSIINTKLSENISGMRTIQIFNQEKQISEEFDEVNQEYLILSEKEVRNFAIYRPAIEMIRSFVIAALLWFGGLRNLEGVLTFGILNAFIDYIQRFFNPILELAETYNIIQSAVTSTSRIFHLLDEPEETSGGKIAIPDKTLRGEIEFKNVWFAYNDSEWILKDVSFKIEAGQFVAFVGATGAGKSTIMNLLMRFYDIQKGQILLDGRDIKKYKITDLRQSIGVVQQDVFLYSGLVIDNITLKRENVSSRDGRKAAEIVNANSFICELPNQYNQHITERGSTLSVGERQLLSFARTLATKPTLLILDEATANIDTETEALIQDAIRNMANKRTMLAVAHRISTIADADKIIVLHKGRIAEQGTKDELLAHAGLFSILYKLQYERTE